VILATLFLSQPAQAVKNGTDVSHDDYQDFVVQIADSDGEFTSVCGGTLLGKL
jgi:hypothetical protein